MSKTRVYQLAKEFGMHAKEFLEELRDLGYNLKSHMSSLEEEEVKTIKEYFEEKLNENKKEKVIDEKKELSKKEVVKEKKKIEHKKNKKHEKKKHFEQKKTNEEIKKKKRK
nr:translation initiation factor IF-2 N-terminal domain-containing protein [Marinitoga lauensis]